MPVCRLMFSRILQTRAFTQTQTALQPQWLFTALAAATGTGGGRMLSSQSSVRSDRKYLYKLVWKWSSYSSVTLFFSVKARELKTKN